MMTRVNAHWPLWSGKLVPTSPPTQSLTHCARAWPGGGSYATGWPDTVAARALLADQEKAGGERLAAIAVTADAMTHHVEGYLWHGLLTFVAKPLRSEHLAAALLACHAQLTPG